jgi:hypothetical protein
MAPTAQPTRSSARIRERNGAADKAAIVKTNTAKNARKGKRTLKAAAPKATSAPPPSRRSRAPPPPTPRKPEVPAGSISKFLRVSSFLCFLKLVEGGEMGQEEMEEQENEDKDEELFELGGYKITERNENSAFVLRRHLAPVNLNIESASP